ncbi:hypothetical protein GH733_018241 [Mirounga leonina]|nr:hypothetical protein GH733_018241 [Mirounga leonina]
MERGEEPWQMPREVPGGACSEEEPGPGVKDRPCQQQGVYKEEPCQEPITEPLGRSGVQSPGPGIRQACEGPAAAPVRVEAALRRSAPGSSGDAPPEGRWHGHKASEKDFPPGCTLFTPQTIPAQGDPPGGPTESLQSGEAAPRQRSAGPGRGPGNTYYVPGGLLGAGGAGVSSVDPIDALDVAKLLCAVQPSAGRTSPLGSEPGN